MTIRLLLVDDHEVVRAGLRMLLARFGDLEVLGEAADGQAALAAVDALQPDVVLMDLSMPGMDGVTATRALSTAHPDLHVVVLTTFADRDHVTAAIDAGAVGFLLKDAHPDALAEGIRAAVRGQAPLDPRAAMALIDRRRDPALSQGSDQPDRSRDHSGSTAPTLTAREREVLALVGEGLSNRLISRRLGIAEKTVKAHLTSIFSQIGVTDRVQAALWWQRHSS